VSIEKKNTKNYFTRGWSRLRDFYGIGLGGWATLLYISHLPFHIRVRKIIGLEVAYPKKPLPVNLCSLNIPIQVLQMDLFHILYLQQHSVIRLKKH
jgi:hypothetical protein